jgi:fatty-acyl-CoA synthase
MNSKEKEVSDFKEFEGMTFGRILDKAAAEVPDKEMIVFKDQRITYGQFHQKVKQLARGLKRLGIKKGDRIAALFPNCPNFFVVHEAVLYIGAIFIPLSTRYREYELSYMLQHSDARCIFMVDEYLKVRFIDILEKIRPELPALEFCFVDGKETPSWARTYDYVMELGKAEDDALLKEDLPVYDDIASILYTSGSTGTPKGVVMSHRAFIFGAIRVSRRLRITPDDVMLMGMPCSHTVCSYIQFPNAMMGRCKIVILETFEAGEALRMYDTERVSLIYAAPTMFVLMLQHPTFAEHDFSSSRAGYSGGSIIPEDLMMQVRNKMNCRLVSVYGMSEVGAVTMNDVEDDASLEIGTVGTALEGIEVKVMNDKNKELPAGEVGEVVIKGPNVLEYYYKQPDLTKAAFDSNGYFYSGDLGKYLENGRLTIVGRRKEMIIRGGFNIYPAEVEEQIRLMGNVQNVAVVGIPDEVMGEKIVAFVVPVPGTSLDEKAVVAFCRSRVANYKVPNLVRIVGELPQNAAGKVQKFKLLDMLKAE